VLGGNGSKIQDFGQELGRTILGKFLLLPPPNSHLFCLLSPVSCLLPAPIRLFQQALIIGIWSREKSQGETT
ncbi:hypothetical protein, partial [Okeania sp. SIO3B5]|uniref:hypothetical protein n=1 Tax=Okeania sp. SIO3B5 TaxID=2607811 RepID=UPI0025FFE12F